MKELMSIFTLIINPIEISQTKDKTSNLEMMFRPNQEHNYGI